MERPDGPPLSVPVWYVYEPGRELWVLTAATSRKGRLLDRARWYSLCAQYEDPAAYAYVTVEGPVTTVEPADREDHRRRIAHRYLGPELGEAYLDATDIDTTRFAMRPERWWSADYEAAPLVSEAPRAWAGRERGLWMVGSGWSNRAGPTRSDVEPKVRAMFVELGVELPPRHIAGWVRARALAAAVGDGGLPAGRGAGALWALWDEIGSVGDPLVAMLELHDAWELSCGVERSGFERRIVEFADVIVEYADDHIRAHAPPRRS